MKTAAKGRESAFKPYTQYEVNLILSLVPNKANTLLLSKSLHRSSEAISMVYHIAYSGKWLKNALADMNDTQNNINTKIAAAKKKYGIYVGHEPR